MESMTMGNHVEHFCTLFDIGYLPQGMALHESLQRHAGDFVLWILCMDREVEEALNILNLPSVRLIPIREVETPELLIAKATRSHGEYCWTLSPFLPSFVFIRDPGIDRVTYLDSDIWLLNSPEPIFEEFEQSGKHILYTEHGYSAEYDQSLVNGRYCVQLLIYKNTQESQRVLKWWGERCLEWCYAHRENGKFGDQRYLEQWEYLFKKETHLLQRPEFTLAPWNATRFPIGSAVLFHFHGLRIYDKGILQLWINYRIPRQTQVAAYYRYVAILKTMVHQMISAGISGRFRPAPHWKFRHILLSLQNHYGSGNWNRMIEKLKRHME